MEVCIVLGFIFQHFQHSGDEKKKTPKGFKCYLKRGVGQNSFEELFHLRRADSAIPNGFHK